MRLLKAADDQGVPAFAQASDDLILYT